jgi:hypothetical protein
VFTGRHYHRARLGEWASHISGEPRPWGVQEVRKLHAELDMLAIQAVREHDLTQAITGHRTTRYDRSRATIRSFP